MAQTENGKSKKSKSKEEKSKKGKSKKEKACKGFDKKGKKAKCNYRAEECTPAPSDHSDLPSSPPADLWNYTTGGGVQSSPALNADGTVVNVGSFDTKLYAINTADGTEIWNYTTGNIVQSSPALNADGTVVYVGSNDYNLYAMNGAVNAVNFEC